MSPVGHTWVLLLLICALSSAKSIKQPDEVLDALQQERWFKRESNDQKVHAVPATATIDSGTVIGTTTSLPDATAGVNKFLGVPFAKSPPERFTPPEKPAHFKKPFHADAVSPACIQEFTFPKAERVIEKGIFNQPPPKQSEDCLYLNVYTPSTPAPAGGRAVMFWIYGGGLAFGDSGLAAYDGSAFAAEQDVVFVSTNYRTNVFGFPNAPGLGHGKSNLGFLDQRFALDWVQRNIHAFGGDPKKVTIFGESAGAFSVDTLLTTFTTETAPFRAAILESGQISYSGTLELGSRSSWLTLTDALKCSPKGSAQANLTCVRKAPAAKIRSIIDHKALAFNPVPDNVTYPSSAAGNREAGNFAKVPVLGGTNYQEGRVFELGQDNLTSYLDATFGIVAPQIIPKLKKAFPVGNDSGVNTAYDQISKIDTLLTFQCGQALWARESHHFGVPTWRYFFNASFPNYSPFDGLLGVFHSSEIPLVFQSYSGGPVNPRPSKPLGLIPAQKRPTAQQEALSRFMNSAWANFAKNPEGGPGWNALGTFGRDGRLGVLGADGSSGVTVVKADPVDSDCELLRPAFKAVTGNVFGLH